MQTTIEKLFDGKKKLIIGMVHFPALPGTPLYDDTNRGMKQIRCSARPKTAVGVDAESRAGELSPARGFRGGTESVI